MSPNTQGAWDQEATLGGDLRPLNPITHPIPELTATDPGSGSQLSFFFLFFFFFFVFLPLLGPLLQHVEVPRLGVESEL